MNPSAQMIVKLNIGHYRKLLMTERDPKKRAIISGLLSEEEEKLTALPGVPRSLLEARPLPPMSGLNEDPSAG